MIDADKLIESLNPAPEEIQQLIEFGQNLAQRIEINKIEQYELLRKVLDHVEVGNDYFILQVKAKALIEKNHHQLIPIRTQMLMRRCGYAMKLIITDGSSKANLDENLIRYIRKGFQWRNLLISGKAQSVKEIARTVGIDPSHVTRAINRTFLAPEIIRAVLNGQQPIHFNLKYLKQFRSLPNDWQQQKVTLGFTQ